MKKTDEEKQPIITDTNAEKDPMQKQGGTNNTSAGKK